MRLGVQYTKRFAGFSGQLNELCSTPDYMVLMVLNLPTKYFFKICPKLFYIHTHACMLIERERERERYRQIIEQPEGAREKFPARHRCRIANYKLWKNKNVRETN